MSESNPNRGLVPSAQLLLKAYDGLQNDMEDRLKDFLEEKTQILTAEMARLKSGMEAMKTHLENLHKQNSDGKKKIETLEEKLKENEKEFEKLASMNEDKQGTSGMNGNGVTDDKNRSASEDKNFTFSEAVHGKNVMIGNEVAAVSEGGQMKFAELKNDPNSMVNKNAKLPDGEGARAGDVNLAIDGTFVGNEKVNIQTNEQSIYLGGPKNIEVDDNGKVVEYHKADRDELSGYIYGLSTAERGDDSISLVSLSDSEEETLNRNTIARVAQIYKEDGRVESFIRLCDLLVNLTSKQRRSLAPDLNYINRINLENVEIESDRFSVFFKCFKGKRFDWLLMRNRSIKAKDIQMLASSLSSCKIDYLDMGICSFEYMAFLKLSALLPRVNYLILRRLTGAHIISEIGNNFTTLFSVNEARQLSTTILNCKQNIGLELSECDFTNYEIATEFANCLTKISILSIKHGIVNQNSFKLLAAGITHMQKLELSCVDLRNVGMEEVAPLLTKVKVLLLSNVMLTDDAVQPLIQAMNELPENAMEALDISFNPLKTKTISEILANVEKVKLLVFSSEQITAIHMDEVDKEKVLMSETVDGIISRLDDTTPEDSIPTTYWIACVKPVDNVIRHHVMDITRIHQQELDARNVANYHCSNCRTFIAFARDSIQSPCTLLHKDKTFWGVLEKSFLVTVSQTTSLVPSSTSGKIKHSCSVPNCPAHGFKMRICKCAVCGQTIGGKYQNASQQVFYCLYQGSANSFAVGRPEQLCSQS